MSKYHGTYGKTLLDPRWKEKRKVILARDQNRCVICKSEESLQVHHRQYH
jgi:C4-dicarboxylate-specific signal transduction histidine kinase